MHWVKGRVQYLTDGKLIYSKGNKEQYVVLLKKFKQVVKSTDDVRTGLVIQILYVSVQRLEAARREYYGIIFAGKRDIPNRTVAIATLKRFEL